MDTDQIPIILIQIAITQTKIITIHTTIKTLIINLPQAVVQQLIDHHQQHQQQDKQQRDQQLPEDLKLIQQDHRAHRIRQTQEMAI